MRGSHVSQLVFTQL